MTNDELTNAINQTHKLISATAQREPPYEGLCKHLSELLLIQQRRAAVEPLISKEDLK